MNNKEMILKSCGPDNRHMPNSKLHKGNKAIGTVCDLLWGLLSALKNRPFLVDSRDVSRKWLKAFKIEVVADVINNLVTGTYLSCPKDLAFALRRRKAT